MDDDSVLPWYPATPIDGRLGLVFEGQVVGFEPSFRITLKFSQLLRNLGTAALDFHILALQSFEVPVRRRTMGSSMQIPNDFAAIYGFRN